MLKDIYRKEAIEFKKSHWKGKALLLAGMPAWLVTLLSFIFLFVLIATLILGKYTQRIDVRGEVITLPHSVNVMAPQQGFIVKQYVKVGELVKKGQALYEIDVSRHTTSGSVNIAQANVINEKIDNASDIIAKLNQNKTETLAALDAQLVNAKKSLQETPARNPSLSSVWWAHYVNALAHHSLAVHAHPP
jgi:membrane fusion protein